jgi:hypothetical protein
MANFSILAEFAVATCAHQTADAQGSEVSAKTGRSCTSYGFNRTNDLGADE